MMSRLPITFSQSFEILLHHSDDYYYHQRCMLMDCDSFGIYLFSLIFSPNFLFWKFSNFKKSLKNSKMNNHIPVTESHQFSVSAPPLTLPLTVPFLVHWDNYLVKPSYNFYRGLPGGTSGKGPACQCKLDIRDTCSIPGCGRSLGAGHSNLLQYSCLENPTDRRAWQAEVLSVAQSQTQLKQLSTAQLFIFLLIVYYYYMFETEKCQSMNYVILTLTPEQTFNIPSDLSSILLK